MASGNEFRRIPRVAEVSCPARRPAGEYAFASTAAPVAHRLHVKGAVVDGDATLRSLPAGGRWLARHGG